MHAATIIGMATAVINKSQSQIILSTLSRYMQPICMIARCAGPTVRRTIPASLPYPCFPQETRQTAVASYYPTTSTSLFPIPCVAIAAYLPGAGYLQAAEFDPGAFGSLALHDFTLHDQIRT